MDGESHRDARLFFVVSEGRAGMLTEGAAEGCCATYCTAGG